MLKSRVTWLSLGDKNTKKFHKASLIKRRKNKFIHLLVGENNWICNPQDVGHEIRNSLLENLCPSINVISPDESFLQLLSKLTVDQNLNLTSRPTTLEIKTTLWDDGLYAAFYQKNWELINHKIYNDFLNIFTTWSIPSSWCKTLICLILKIKNSYTTYYCKPLGICTTHYKILAKVLICRIWSFLQHFISPFQGAFSKGKHYADIFLLAQETLHSMNSSKSKQGWLILKLDIRKAFDTISWSF